MKTKTIAFTQTYEVECIITAIVPEDWTDEKIEDYYTDYSVSVTVNDIYAYDSDEAGTFTQELYVHSVNTGEWHRIEAE